MPTLVYFIGDQRHSYKLTAAQTDIGRGKTCLLRLQHDPEISRIHCSVHQCIDNSYALIDAASRNGTYLNGKRIGNAEMPLADGDVIKIGHAWLTFHHDVVTSETLLREVEHEIKQGHGFSTIMHHILNDK